jgi:hypothetical protein
MHFGFMKTPKVMDGLKLAYVEPELGIDPQNHLVLFRAGDGDAQERGVSKPSVNQP